MSHRCRLSCRAKRPMPDIFIIDGARNLLVWWHRDRGLRHILDLVFVPSGLGDSTAIGILAVVC